MGTIIDRINWATRTFEPFRPEANITHINRQSDTSTRMDRETAVYDRSMKLDVPKPIKPEKEKPVTIEVLPWQTLPEGYADYRPLLQRDGLILFAWEIWGDKIRVIWLAAANRKMHRYEAWTDNEGDLKTICPESRYDCRHYRDSTKKVGFIIYAAPPGLTVNTKSAFIAKLRENGSSVNFDYDFTLGKQKAEQEKVVFDKIENRLHKSNLNPDESEFLKAYQKLDSTGKAKLIELMGTMLKNQGGKA